MTIHCYAAMSSKQPLSAYQYDPIKLEPWDCRVDITHCGICHSDLHLIDNDWGISQYPLVPGHEIVGIVSAMGEQVKHLQLGQRVGIGWQCGSCMECEWCLAGEQNFCDKQIATCVKHFGGFAQAIQVDSRLAVTIPDKLDSEHVAPLFCGGITVFNPLVTHVHTPNAKVGIIGIGGLGHMAIQFARALGFDVTAFSSSANKENEAKRLGAHHFISSTDPTALKKMHNHFDFILNTAPASLAWEEYINLLRPRGKLCFVGVPGKNINLSAMSLISDSKSLCGSNIGGIDLMKKMLDFAAEHNIKAQTELFKLSEVNHAIEKLRKNQVRYRAVLRNNL